MGLRSFEDLSPMLSNQNSIVSSEALAHWFAQFLRGLCASRSTLRVGPNASLTDNILVIVRAE
jgi:hypothetical protein